MEVLTHLSANSQLSFAGLSDKIDNSIIVAVGATTALCMVSKQCWLNFVLLIAQV